MTLLKVPWAAVLCMTVVLLLGVTATAKAGSVASTDPRALVLAINDLPTGYAFRTSRSQSNGYEASYVRDAATSTALTGALDIDSYANVYRSSKGAYASYADKLAHCNTKPFRQVSLSKRIGDDAALCVATFAKKGNLQGKVFTVIWRHGKITATVATAGLDGGIAPQEAITLAVKQDKRISRNA